MIGVYIGIGVAVVLLIWVIVVRNGLAKKKMRIDNSLSQIKIQSKKRLDLIPNLVEVARSKAKQNEAGVAPTAELKEELARVEKAITISRQVHNDSVMMYNRAVAAFPNSIIATIFRYKKAGFLEVTEEQEFKVSVDLFCKHCGTRNPASAVRCTGCGSGLN